MRIWGRAAVLGLAAQFLLLVACSRNNDLQAELSPGFAGSAIKGPISDAEVHAFHFDAVGTEVEIPARNAPVYTDAEGRFEFRILPEYLSGVTSPIIVRTSGGTMYGKPAPILEGVIPDPEALRYGQVTLGCPLSTASSVAAGLLKNLAQELGTAPQPYHAVEVCELVETELWVDLSESPREDETGVARVNHCADENLDLMDLPEANKVVADFVDYLIANLSSNSQELDAMMVDPANPGSDTPASFGPFGDLPTALPGGPSAYVDLSLAKDKPYIGIDGEDTATVRATLTDARGQPIPGAKDLSVVRASGNAMVERVEGPASSNELKILVTALTVGETVLEVACPLANGNIVEQRITIPAVDLITDTDGDGTPDGEETFGWTVIIDGNGYGEGAGGAFLTVKEVTSDPNVVDTDGDGLDDSLEYLIRTDPRTADTDGDGLTDAAEWRQWMTNPNSVDTDADSRGPGRSDTPKSILFDGNELTMLKTSPTLADTDGDGRTDFEEADHPTRSPLISDLPKLEIEVVDAIDIRLDVEYAEEQGKTTHYGTEFSEAVSAKVGYSVGMTVGASLEVGGEVEAGLFDWGKATSKVTATVQASWTANMESSITSQESYSEYTEDARTRTETAASGSMSMGIRLKNAGQVTYTLTQLGVTVRQWVPASEPDSPGSFKTLATLKPNLQGPITLAPGATSPVLQVEASDLNASRVKEFLARPDSLYLEPAYYELENAEGLNFDYLEEFTGPQTARVVIDYGDGNWEDYRIATNVERIDGGAYAGISMQRILRDLLDIPYLPDPDNAQALYSVRGVKAREEPKEGLWQVFLQSDSSQGGADFEAITLYGGDSVLLSYVKDQDKDGLWGPEEEHYDGDDSVADSDEDGLNDVEEIRGEIFTDDDGSESPCGWVVRVKDHNDEVTAEYPIVSDPTNPDQDKDGLNDFQEKVEGTDPTRPDTDNDGLRDDVDPYPGHTARVLHVKADADGNRDGSSWEDAYADLNLALGDARTANQNASEIDDVSEVWVAAGVYQPDAGDSFNLINGVSLYGGFSGAEEETKQTHRESDPRYNGTELVGQGSNVVLADSTVGAATVIDGFLIRDGKGTGASAGGGIRILGDLTLKNLFFLNNESVWGGAVSIEPASGDPVETSISNCVFNRNSATDTAADGGGAIRQINSHDPHLGELRITDCVFEENHAGYGGGAIYSVGDIEVSRCRFSRNKAELHGGAVWVMGGAAEFTNCRVSSNYTRNPANAECHGGGLYAGAGCDLVLRQCAIWSNKAFAATTNNSGGGAVYVEGAASSPSRLRLIQSTITKNYADVAGGLFFTDNTSAEIENSIVFGNEAWHHDLALPESHLGREIRVEGDLPAIYAELRLRNSCVYKFNYVWTGTKRYDYTEHWLDSGNIGDQDEEPELDSNLRLGTDSACIDRGNNFLDYDPLSHGFQLLPEADLAGDWRVVDGDYDGDAIVDMGAYEYQYASMGG